MTIIKLLYIIFITTLFTKFQCNNLPFTVEYHNNNNNSSMVILNRTQLNPFFNISKIYDNDCACSYNNDIFYESPSNNSTSFIINTTNLASMISISKLSVSTNNNKIPSFFSFSPINSTSGESIYNLSIIYQCSDSNTPSNYAPAMNSYISNNNKFDNNPKYSFLSVDLKLSDRTDYTFSYIKFCEFESPKISVFSSIILFLIAFGYLVISTSMQIKTKVIQEMNEMAEIKWWHSLIFILFASCFWLLIFFFIDYILVIFNIWVAFQCSTCMYFTFTFYLKKVFIKSKYPFKLFNLSIYHYISGIITLFIIGYYFFSKHWIMNNIIAFGLVFTIWSVVWFKSFKVCFVFLVCLFVYDTFWVFYSNKIFSGNVMITAATRIKLPIKLEMPLLFSNNPIKDCMLLGLGDIALPGMIVKYCRRFDVLNYKENHCKGGYYLWSLVWYISSVGLAMWIMFVSGHGQPVLFYISPIFIVGWTLLSIIRKEFHLFWNGIKEQKQGEDDNNRKEENEESDSTQWHELKIFKTIETIE